MNEQEVDRALALDAQWVASLRAAWLILVELAVFGDVASSRIGAAAKFRKRVLESGECLRSLAADRAWIPHPRERLKNALAAAMLLRDALGQLDRATALIDRGGDRAALIHIVAELTHLVDDNLGPLETRWASILDNQLCDSSPDQ